MNKKSVTNKLPSSRGFTLKNRISKNELDIFKKAINKQWLKRIKDTSPQIAEEVIKKKITIENYHKISFRLKHQEIWRKSQRILPKDFVNWFLKSEFANSLKIKYGEFSISDEDNLGWPNIYWRLVRPKESTDIGPLHRDSWFWELNKHFPKPGYNFTRLKVWIPIYSENGLNGLLVEPFSHLRTDIRWEGELRDNIRKPVLITPKNKLKPILLNTEEGETVVFNDNLIHGGALNKAEKCRVSVEFTLLIRTE